MHPRLISVLACPHCRGAVRTEGDHITCEACASSFEIRNGTAVFLSGSPAVVATEHKSNPLAPQYEAVLRAGNDFVLNIGAGGTAQRYPNCIEFEHKIFRYTDVVGDAHCLPFRNDSLDRVFAFNVFEHLRTPKTTATEILRVLKPGGSVSIHTAFLQALHEEPNHFFNATEFGVREWFSDFEIERCDVSPNFGPGVMLGYLAANLLEVLRRSGVSGKEEAMISGTTIGEWAEFWSGKAEPPPGFTNLQGLPQDMQKRVAAGFELVAHKSTSAR
jgi:SAM-dependent methyltransferase